MTELRHDFSKVANQVTYGGQRIRIKKNGDPAFALVPIEDLEVLEALEDQIDLKDALKALKEPGSIRLEDFKKKLGL